MRYRAGLLGAARIAPKAFIAPAIARGDIDIVAVGCRDADKALRFIADNNLKQAEAVSYAEVCTDPSIDIVYCALPPAGHLEWVSLALNNGKAVLCEKPFSMNADEARKMTAISESSGSFLMEGYHYYFHKAFKFVAEKIEAGAIGTPVRFRGEFSHQIKNENNELRYRRELGGGALMDLGCYPLHAFRQIIGEPEVKIACAVTESGVDVSMQAGLLCGDVSGEVICDMGPNASGIVRLEITGTQGVLIFDNFVAPHNGHTITINRGSAVTRHTSKGPSTYAAQLDCFIRAIGETGTPLSLEDARNQMIAIDAIYTRAGFP